ncbi:hypothetical protein X777_13248 [Ooceraea biroi]|uniref:C-type lectin domain-containing protein n=1 Tax=Ooceraea biroi TaxID=2015173 RepID=A0A026VXT1_OOCBI|nr:hypothetical protein X777_13248 [Ooceraea biroi]
MRTAQKVEILDKFFKGKKKSKGNITEGSSVLVDGQRYTLYKIVDDEDEKTLRAEGVRKVNGGGVTWKEARLQCKKRGKHLAMVFTNEAATVIANAMLRSRPCNEASFVIFILNRQICLMRQQKKSGISKSSFTKLVIIYGKLTCDYQSRSYRTLVKFHGEIGNYL